MHVWRLAEWTLSVVALYSVEPVKKSYWVFPTFIVTSSVNLYIVSMYKFWAKEPEKSKVEVKELLFYFHKVAERS